MALKAFPRVKVRKDYNGKVVAIKKKLSGYDDASFITMMYDHFQTILKPELGISSKEGANKQVISSQADSLIKISRIWADFFPANTSNQPI
ncbi:hypothetical protein KS910_27065 [Klebsiella pneumoniae]|nr:hypothetical protein [Klebsiella pneumoniae]MBV7362414.1 hypothetical protein [Klebsiella pneumoniae]